MSCGEPHDIDCSEILQRVYVFLDHELEDASLAEIQQHLDECAPCLELFDLEMVVKKLVHRSCGSDHAPESLRARVLLRITEVRTELHTD